MRQSHLNGGVVNRRTRGSPPPRWMRHAVHALLLVAVFVIGLLALFSSIEQVGAQEPDNSAEQVEFRKPGPVLGGLLTTDGRYIVQANETCWDVAATFNNAARWKQLLVANTTTISQEANARGVSFEECPLQPGMVLDIPSHWVPDRFRFVEVLVDDDWPHWKTFSTWGVSIALVVGLVAGAIVVTTIGRILKDHERPELGHS